MVATTGVSPEAISLPKGGGAVRSLGATFDTDLNTGSGSYTVPIDLPAGPNAIKPQVDLRYQTSSANGPFGFGWALSQLAIARESDGRIPAYDDTDEFLLPGSETLVEIEPNRYRPKVDTMHWRIERSDNSWILISTWGARHRLGISAQSRIGRPGSTGATAIWLLEEMEDTNGNKVVYRYRAEGAQRYLASIEWGTYELRFVYEQRPDPVRSGRLGFLLTTGLRCASLELHITTLEPSLARSWTFDYEQAEGAGWSLLSKVTHRGHPEVGDPLAGPPLTFGYSPLLKPILQRRTAARHSGLPPLRSGRFEMVDWNGDGLPDLLGLHRGRARVWPNLGRGRWGRPRTVGHLPVAVALDDPGVAFADFAGNGTADLIWLDRPLTGHYPLKPGGGFDAPRFERWSPSPALSDRDSRLVDLDGDGVVDLLSTRGRFWELYFRTAHGGWRRKAHLVASASAPPVRLSDPRVHLADMNGDGLVDLVRVTGAGVACWPYVDIGVWGGEIRLENPPDLPRNFDPQRLQLTDITGDGCADLVYVAFDRVFYWLNAGGFKLGERREVRHTPPSTLEDLRWGDMEGTGTTGILWSLGTGARRGEQFYLDLAGGS